MALHLNATCRKYHKARFLGSLWFCCADVASNQRGPCPRRILQNKADEGCSGSMCGVVGSFNCPHEPQKGTSAKEATPQKVGDLSGCSSEPSLFPSPTPAKKQTCNKCEVPSKGKPTPPPPNHPPPRTPRRYPPGGTRSSAAYESRPPEAYTQRAPERVEKENTGLLGSNKGTPFFSVV